jgi:SAM-dependent methyltransferase
MATNWFDRGGRQYAQFRPEYPPELARYLSDIAPAHDAALDVGCGNGQLALQLAGFFKNVVAADPSADQIANATPHVNVRYVCAPAENLPVGDRSASLITAAQAAHWFRLPEFYGEARRIGTDGAILALISYGVLKLEPELQERFARFYYQEIGPYWPPERKLVDSGYADIDFPFEAVTAPAIAIAKEWNLGQLLGYIATWSAARSAREAGREKLLQDFAEDLSALWGDPARPRPVSWPIAMRIGRL